LRNVDFVVSDDHRGPREAIAKNFMGATWQRCQVHLMRNILAHSPRKERETVAADAKLVFQSPDRAEANRRHAALVQRFAKVVPKAVAYLGTGFEDAMAVLCLPRKYQRQLRTTNMQERLD